MVTPAQSTYYTPSASGFYVIGAPVLEPQQELCMQRVSTVAAGIEP